MLTNKTSTVSKNNLKNLHFLSQTARLLRFSYSFIEDTTMTNTTQPTVIILGASYAGLMACARLLHSRQKIQIMVIDAKTHFEQKIRLHETLVGDETRRLALAPLLKKRGVTFIQAKVNGLRPDTQQVLLEDGQRLNYDYLIYALGSVPSQKIHGSEQHAISMASCDQLQHTHLQLQQLAQQQGHIVVLGAGLTAIEVCTELATRFSGLKLSLISKQFPSFHYHPHAQQHLTKFFAQQQIDIIADHVDHIDQKQLHTKQQQVIPFDLCIDCTGLKANPLAQQSQLKVDELGRLYVDEYLRLLGSETIFVVGDAARVTVNQQILRMSCATAMPIGAHAGTNIVRLLAKKPLVAFNFAYLAQFLSLGRKNGLMQMVDEQDQARSQISTGFWAARYKEWICKMTINMIYWELRTGLKLYFWPKQSSLTTYQLPNN